MNAISKKLIAGFAVSAAISFASTNLSAEPAAAAMATNPNNKLEKRVLMSSETSPKGDVTIVNCSDKEVEVSIIEFFNKYNKVGPYTLAAATAGTPDNKKDFSINIDPNPISDTPSYGLNPKPGMDLSAFSYAINFDQQERSISNIDKQCYVISNASKQLTLNNASQDDCKDATICESYLTKASNTVMKAASKKQ